MDTDVDLTTAPAARARELARSGRLTTPTSGLCLGHVQANLVILRAEAAGEFAEFCLANARAMPLIEVTRPGDPAPRRVAPGADLRTDVPRYRVYRDGALVDEPTDVRELWTDDSVGFLLGCSFTAESALLEAGVRLRHQELGRNVPMFVTSVPCRPAGRFHGPVVVSMRPIQRGSVETAARVTARYPVAHGAPLHVGDGAAIGVTALDRPDFGDAVEPVADEVPVFWACGVTPQAAIMAVRPALAITHAPGHMFISDLRDAEVRDREPLGAADL
jgi:uncharacterized protein YcsI (UPF0317 family)